MLLIVSVLSMHIAILIYKSCQVFLPHTHSGDIYQDSVVRIAKLTRKT